MSCGCGCARALGRRVDPFLARHVGCAPPVVMGDVLPKFTYPSDVTAIKRQIDPTMTATNAAAVSCSRLSPGELSAWREFYSAWRAFYAEPEPWVFGSANLYDEARDYRDRLAGWQDQLRQKCVIPGPIVTAEVNELPAAIKWASVGAIAVAVAVTAYSVRSVFR